MHGDIDDDDDEIGSTLLRDLPLRRLRLRFLVLLEWLLLLLLLELMGLVGVVGASSPW